jgi:hypothetical protein
MSYPVDPLIVAIDPGASSTEYVSPWHSGYFASIYSEEEPGIDFEALATVDDFVIERLHNKRWQRVAIGKSASRLGSISVRTLDRARVLSVDYKILIDAALAASMEQDGDISPVLNLPVEWYQRREEVKAFLGGIHMVRYNGKESEFHMPADRIRIIPEGFGALCNEMLDDTGKAVNAEYAKMKVGVIDMGMKTTDCSLFDNLAIVPVKTRGFEMGLSQALISVQRRAEREMEYRFELEALDGVLSGERVSVGGQDVTDQICEWLMQSIEQVSNSVIGSVRQLWQSGNDANVILLRGGTMKYAAPYFEAAFAHGRTSANNPATDNVEGAMKYALMKERQR